MIQDNSLETYLMHKIYQSLPHYIFFWRFLTIIGCGTITTSEITEEWNILATSKKATTDGNNS